LAACQAAGAAAETVHQAEAAARLQQIAGLEQTLALRDQACAAYQAQIDTLRQEAARRDTLYQVQMKLRDWQLARLSEKPRFGGPPGPSGGKLADEVAAVARHPLFDAAWYQSSYPDTQGTALSAAEHFLRHGFYEGRDPGPRLRLLDWFAAHPQVLAARKNPLLDPDLVP
jgi:hypothetical protein